MISTSAKGLVDVRSVTCVLMPGFEKVLCPLVLAFPLPTCQGGLPGHQASSRRLSKYGKKETHSPLFLCRFAVPAYPCTDELCVCVTLTLLREQSKQESIAQICVPEYMKSVQQIPAGLLHLLSHLINFLVWKYFHTICCLWSCSTEQYYWLDDFYCISSEILM